MDKHIGIDFLSDSPVTAFKSAGTIGTRPPRWSWTSDELYSAFYIVSEGEVTLKIHGESCTLYKDDAFFIRDGEVAVISNESDKEMATYYVSFYRDPSRELGINTVLRNMDCLRLFKELQDARFSTAPLSKVKIAQLFIQLYYTYALGSLRADEEYSDTSKIQVAVEYINRNYSRKITLDELCSVSGYSPAHLRRLFLKKFSSSPQQYIIERRIEISKQMLTDIPDRSVDEVAQNVGMCSPSYFCKLFRRLTGQTPLEYKNRMRSKPSV